MDILPTYHFLILLFFICPFYLKGKQTFSFKNQIVHDGYPFFLISIQRIFEIKKSRVFKAKLMNRD